MIMRSLCEIQSNYVTFNSKIVLTKATKRQLHKKYMTMKCIKFVAEVNHVIRKEATTRLNAKIKRTYSNRLEIVSSIAMSHVNDAIANQTMFNRNGYEENCILVKGNGIISAK